MMRRSWSGVFRCSVALVQLASLAACARSATRAPASVPEEVTSASTAMPAGTTLAGGETETRQRALATVPIDVREIKLIDDNGQQGLFTKLSGPPAALTHFTMTQPTRVVIDIAGAAGVTATPEANYAATNPLVESVRVVGRDGSIRLTVTLRGDSVPSYTVNDLNDTVVAFFGEPGGGSAPVAEEVLFTRRGEDTTPRASARARSAPVAAPPPVPRRRSAPPPADVAGATGDLAAVASGDEPSPRPTPKVYYGQHVSLDFKDADVNNVLRLLAEVSRLNIVATDDVKGRVTLRLFDVPWDQALDVLLQVLNLESVQEGDVIRISTVKRLREEREERAKAQEAQKAVEPLEVEYIRVNYAKATKLAELISGAAARARGGQTTTRGRQEEGVLSSRGSVFADEYANMLIVRDIRRGIDNALELVRKLDVQTPQVLIESSIVEATTDFARDLGVQWGYRYLAGPAVGSSTGVNFPGSIGLGGSGLGSGAGGVPFIADFPAAGVVPGSGTALALALGSLDGSQSLDVRLTALEKEGKARIISRPRVITLNNVAATIKSLRILRVKLPSTGTVINTGAGGAAGGQSTATEKIETGIILVVTPQVSSDGFVLLDMFAKSSTADFAQQVDQIPTEVSREANSHILVKNGQTVVLGGIYRDNLSDAVTGVPYLRNIPGLGWLFRTNSTKNTREDLLVFLTPRIVGGGTTRMPSAEDLWEHRGIRKEG